MACLAKKPCDLRRVMGDDLDREDADGIADISLARHAPLPRAHLGHGVALAHDELRDDDLHERGRHDRDAGRLSDLFVARCIGIHARRPRRPGATRFGEADHPGPGASAKRDQWGILSAQRPNHGGFRHACAPGFQDELIDDGDCPPKDMFALKIATANVTSWGSAINFLHRTDADLLLIQEHKLGEERMEAAIVWLRRRGWHAIMAPAKRGPNGGWSAGVAILAKSHLGISLPAVGSEVVCPAHVVAARVEAPGCRPFLAVSAYLQDGDGLGKTNMGMIQRIGLCIAAQGEDVPFVIGGDFQATPQQLATTGCAGQMGAVIVASADPRGTCRTHNSSREIDYYVVSAGMSAGIATVATVPRSGLRTHCPVKLEFKPRLTSLRALIIRRPPPYPPSASSVLSGKWPTGA